MKFTIESEKVEFKESVSQLSRAIETLAAMLNKHSEGKVIFGVKDNGDVKGVSLGNKTLKDISSQIADKLKPTVIPTISVEYYDEKAVIIVSVKGTNKPYSGNGLYLIRTGSENRRIEPSDLKELVFNSSEDAMTDTESMHQELSFEQLKALLTMKKVKFEENTFKENMNLLTKNKKYNIMAELLADNNDFSIKVNRFKGNDKLHLISRNEYGYKNLFLAMTEAYNYVLSFNETKVELSGKAQRDEWKLFDEESLREAWMNACLHNRWTKLVPPVINMFDDRIEIVSIGGLPVDFPKEEFYRGVSRPVNRSLQKIMGQLGYVEQTGHGVPHIIGEYGKEAFEFLDGFIIVTIKYAFSPTNATTYIEGLTKNEKNIFEMIKINPQMPKKEIAETLELSEPTVSKTIKKLKDMQRIERVGSNKSGYWKIK